MAEEIEDGKSQKVDLGFEEYEKMSMYKKSGVVFEQYKEDDDDELAVILEEEFLEDHDEDLTSMEIQEGKNSKPLGKRALECLERQRMEKIIKLIPNWDTPAAISGKRGYYIDYYKNTFQGVSLAFFMTAYHYDNIYRFDCCSPNANKDIGEVTKDVKDHDAAQSLMFFYKQMD